MTVLSIISIIFAVVMLGFSLMVYRAEADEGDKIGMVAALVFVIGMVLWVLTAFCLLVVSAGGVRKW